MLLNIVESTHTFDEVGPLLASESTDGPQVIDTAGVMRGSLPFVGHFFARTRYSRRDYRRRRWYGCAKSTAVVSFDRLHRLHRIMYSTAVPRKPSSGDGLACTVYLQSLQLIVNQDA